MSSLTAAPFACRICGSTQPPAAYRVREMMFDLREVYDYAQCADCECLQIVDIPADLARHYGPGYYSFAAPPSRGWLGRALIRARNRHLIGRFDPLGSLLAARRPYTALSALRALRLRNDARIVDVGCGGGELLQALHAIGYTRLLGVDPFVAQDLDLGGGLRVLRAELRDQPGPFDLVMFHHSLEHIADQQAALRAAFGALAPGGTCLVRIPTVSSYAWRHYGVDWCALDAPRHLYLHSRASIRRLAADCGFEVGDIVCDANAFQFWGSEQYRRGVPLMRAGCQDIAPAPGQFSADELAEFERQADELNRRDDGDQIVVYLKRPAR